MRREVPIYGKGRLVDNDGLPVVMATVVAPKGTRGLYFGFQASDPTVWAEANAGKLEIEVDGSREQDYFDQVSDLKNHLYYPLNLPNGGRVCFSFSHEHLTALTVGAAIVGHVAVFD